MKREEEKEEKEEEEEEEEAKKEEGCAPGGEPEWPEPSAMEVGLCRALPGAPSQAWEAAACKLAFNTSAAPRRSLQRLNCKVLPRYMYGHIRTRV